jgi:hypothetical protein
MTTFQGENYWWGKTFWHFVTGGRLCLLVKNWNISFAPDVRRYGLDAIKLQVGADIPLGPFFKRNAKHEVVWLPLHGIAWEVTTLFDQQTMNAEQLPLLPPATPLPGGALPAPIATAPLPATPALPPAGQAAPRGPTPVLAGVTRNPPRSNSFRGKATLQPSIQYSSDGAWRFTLEGLRLNFRTLDIDGLAAPYDRLIRALITQIFRVHESGLLAEVLLEYPELRGEKRCGLFCLPFHPKHPPQELPDFQNLTEQNWPSR